MLKIKNNTQKTLSIIGIVGLLLANMFPSIVNAADITIPDSLLASITTSGATYPILNSTDNQGSSSNKQQLPQVTVNFSEDALSQAGTKKMVATATPSYFKNDADPKSLYFTWYLKRAGCDLSCDDGSTPDKNGVCANHKNAKKVAAESPAKPAPITSTFLLESGILFLISFNFLFQYFSSKVNATFDCS